MVRKKARWIGDEIERCSAENQEALAP